jgi:hypothetical protein
VALPARFFVVKFFSFVAKSVAQRRTSSQSDFTILDSPSLDLRSLFWLRRSRAGCSFENTGRRGLRQFRQDPSIPSFQHGALESRLTWMSPECILANLDAGNPCRHDEHLIFMFFGRA